MEYDLIENKSKVYCNGSIWDSNNYGKFEVIGKLNKYRMFKGLKKFTLFLCKFIDEGTLFEVDMVNIKTGNVKNKNFKSIIIDKIDGFEIIKNNSKIYYNGSIWKTNNCGNIKILGKINKVNTENFYKYFLCEFEDGTKVVVYEKAIKLKTITNPNQPSVCHVGFIGQGGFKSIKNNKITNEYKLWQGMISRCYNKKDVNYKNYGAKNIIISNDWYNFQTFCKDILKLLNYSDWKLDTNKKNIWELDKDVLCEKLNIYPKIYSSKTCMFLKKEDNVAESNSRNKLTGNTYVAIRISDGYSEEFTNQRQFSKKYNLTPNMISRCLKGKFSQHKGWKFETKEMNYE